MATDTDTPNEAAHVRAFFSKYTYFEYDATAPVCKEFRRLVRHKGWKAKKSEDEEDEDPEYTAAKRAFAVALGRQFNTFYGSDVNEINSWQALCTALGVDPIPDTLTKCKKIVETTHVNLVDFIDTRITGEPIETFLTAGELRKYTRKEKKFFPKESAKESGVLKYLLRRIFGDPIRNVR